MQSGLLAGTVQHLSSAAQSNLQLELIEQEALLTSHIEGEDLKRSSIRSSLEQQLGLKPAKPLPDTREEGISSMLLDVFSSHEQPLTHSLIHHWHLLLYNGSASGAGQYRTQMVQIVSGDYFDPQVHFLAPPHETVHSEMSAFIEWFNAAHERGAPSPLVLAAIAHLWFECIHPFPDGNGRVGRALVEYSLSKSLGTPSVISLSSAIELKRKAYYRAFEISTRDNHIDAWLAYFVPLLLQAQELSYQKVLFVIQKAKFHDRYRGLLNARQQRLVARVFQEGILGFQGGVSSANYLSITKTSSATASRDLKALVELGAFHKTGDKRHARYWIALDQPANPWGCAQTAPTCQA